MGEPVLPDECPRDTDVRHCLRELLHAWPSSIWLRARGRLCRWMIPNLGGTNFFPDGLLVKHAREAR
jgi:hypothetical protein